MNENEGIILRNDLKELFHPQPSMSLQYEYSTTYGVVNVIMVQKCPKAMNIKFYWLWDQESQKQYKTYWAPGSKNIGDYHKKHHPASHNHEAWNIHLHPCVKQQRKIHRGCVNIEKPHTLGAVEYIVESLNIIGFCTCGLSIRRYDTHYQFKPKNPTKRN